MPLIRDPRGLQIAVLGLLTLYGSLVLDIGLQPGPAGAGVAAALATQLAACRCRGIPFDWRSPLITGLSLALLLRTGQPWLAPAAGVIAIASKFLLRADGRHFFNPSALAIAVVLLASDAAWIAPGQWGNGAFLGLLIGVCGIVVLSRARRMDIGLVFLGLWSALALGRGLYLGDPPAIALHGLGNGALLLFSFFMISDPKSTPLSWPGRLVFALAVASVAGWLRYGLYLPEALVLALVACAPLVPLIDRLLPGRIHTRHDTPPASPVRLPRRTASA